MTIDYRFLTKEEFIPLLNTYRPIVFHENNSIHLEEFYSEVEKQKTEHLNSLWSSQYRIYLTAWEGEQLVGWSWGFQKSGHEFYMCNSAVLPEYRKRKIYSTLLDKVVEKATQDGFQEINSKHHADNNSVIIPKLKKGFVVQGFEINPRFGLMLTLVFYTNAKVQHAHHQRTGYKK